MYESPININYGKMNLQLEGAIVKAVQEIGVTVDKDHLLTALEYDRNQYCKGYEDCLQEENVVRVVRCKECEFFKDTWTSDDGKVYGYCPHLAVEHSDNGYCHYGTKK